MLKKIITLMILVLLMSTNVFADVLIPRMTKVYFEKDGQPYEEEVDYTVSCYGTYNSPWDDQGNTDSDTELKEVFRYSASCPEYGCEIYENYYLNYKEIEYCDLEGETEDGSFYVSNYSDSPIPECEDLRQWSSYDGDYYYDVNDNIIPESELLFDDRGHTLEEICEEHFEIAEIAENDLDFSDVSLGHENYFAINYVADQRIVEGYDDGTYKSGNLINRAEFVKILIGATFDDVEIDGCVYDGKFYDVPDDEWFTKYICLAEDEEIINGYSDGSFKPGNYINFVEAAKVIMKAFDYNLEESDPWYKEYVDMLEFLGAIPSTIYNYSEKISRGEMAEMIYRLKKKITNKSSAKPSVNWN
jgi:hypothetical protein